MATRSPASGQELDLIQRDDLYVKDVVVTVKDLVGSKHLVECVMHVQPSIDGLTAARNQSLSKLLAGIAGPICITKLFSRQINSIDPCADENTRNRSIRGFGRIAEIPVDLMN